MNFTKSLLFGILIVAFMGTLLSGNFAHKPHAVNARPEAALFSKFAAYIDQLDDEELILVVDSLLGIEKVDPMYLQIVKNRVSQYVEMHKEESLYPADEFYHSWDTKKSHPYSDELTKNDTSIRLCLTEREMNCAYHAPFDGRVTSEFGWRKGKMHNGIDIGLLVGDTVKCAFEGVVRLARWQGGYGRTVIVRHYNGLETIYAHLSRYLVKEGDHVDPGTPIARGGNSGASRGSHLHLETRFKGKAINPASFIDFKKGELKHDTLILKKTRYGFIGYQPGGAYHKVRRGDYMYKIASEYGVSIKQICDLNGIRRNHFLVVGEKIKVSN